MDGKKKQADQDVYEEKRQQVEEIAKKLRQDKWDKLVTNLEHDTYGLRSEVYKVLKPIAQNEVHEANLAPLICEILADYFAEL